MEFWRTSKVGGKKRKEKNNQPNKKRSILQSLKSWKYQKVPVYLSIYNELKLQKLRYFSQFPQPLADKQGDKKVVMFF